MESSKVYTTFVVRGPEALHKAALKTLANYSVTIKQEEWSEGVSKITTENIFCLLSETLVRTNKIFGFQTEVLEVTE